MKNKLCFILSLTAYYVAESAPAGLGSLEYDKLDTDLSKLRYEVAEKDLDNFSKLLDDNDSDEGIDKNNKITKSDVNTSGFIKKNTENKKVKSKYNNGGLKRFYNISGADDKGLYDSNDVYAIAKGIIAKAVGIEGSENRKYKKGSKTRGFHRIHNKDEYKKDKIFYEDDEINGSVNKVGAKALGGKFEAGAGFKHGDYHLNRKKGIFGDEGFSNIGYFDKEFSDLYNSKGFKGSFKKDF